ncbi:MAG: response regulator transcription factor [Bacteroidota bacterium]|nr:response regulator transcription factor [Bacteroidota bacterium]
MKRLRILIIDDHRLVRDGIKTMLETQSENYDFDISEAESGEEAVAIIKYKDFDIILVDYQLPVMNGAQTVAQILFFKPKSKILAISNYDEYAYITNMIKVGVKGYVLKNISPNELIRAIETILNGKKYYASDVSEKIIDSEEKKENEKNNPHLKKVHVTKRQVEILKLVATGMTNDAISKKLNLSKRTVDTHRQNLLLKLEVHNTAALIKKATELAIL